ncbi:MerR family transcriptional regulator [Spirosoma endbachense]|uniref:MerR family transcriptional regulator n=1 Tax=Spirosoma endbachense TaxID=2666025 RepID=A0A6P1VP68_9BACT|nr:MerR family transcriptional regulator [Spirosoma endbachense]QHV93770.1 MerR family transcriptional regulator [Spirosoma endbachense]
MSIYPVHKLAKLAGISVRTLHHYDRLGLLKPAVRTEARYRLYGDQELLRLQQILFYKELDFSLEEILQMVKDPNFDQLLALQNHRHALETRRNRLTMLLETIDKTMSKLKGENAMLTDEELYAGFPKDEAEAYRNEAVEKYGSQVVEESEVTLRHLGKTDFDQLKAEQEEIAQSLAAMVNLDPASVNVQEQVARHYANILAFWGKSVGGGNPLEAYKGLAQLYVDDPRFTSRNGQENPEFASFLSKAMTYFVNTRLNG